jgi:hypothetical protein
MKKWTALAKEEIYRDSISICEEKRIRANMLE